MTALWVVRKQRSSVAGSQGVNEVGDYSRTGYCQRIVSSSRRLSHGSVQEVDEVGDYSRIGYCQRIVSSSRRLSHGSVREVDISIVFKVNLPRVDTVWKKTHSGDKMLSRFY